MFLLQHAYLTVDEFLFAVLQVMYSDFLNMVNSGNVRAARFEEGTGRILFDMKPHSSQVAAQAAAEAKLAADQGTGFCIRSVRMSCDKIVSFKLTSMFYVT